jgi:hypothetical protein
MEPCPSLPCCANKVFIKQSLFENDSLKTPVYEELLDNCDALFLLECLQNAGTGKKAPKRSTSSDDERPSPTISPTVATFPPKSSNAARSLAHIRVELEMKSLWEEFHSLGTEMIVTKAGR